MPSKKKAVNSILGVSDGSSTLEERERARETGEQRRGGDPGEGGHVDEQGMHRSQEHARPPAVEKDVASASGQESESASDEGEEPTDEHSSLRNTPETIGLSELGLDTGVEQTAKASYYLSPEQTRRLDDLRSSFRHKANYSPRAASYSRIVGLAIDRLYDEVFSTTRGS